VRMGGIRVKATPLSTLLPFRGDSFMSNYLLGMAVAKSSAARKGNIERPETALFVDLRELFMALGGTSAIASDDLYEFVKEVIRASDLSDPEGDLHIPIPDPEPLPRSYDGGAQAARRLSAPPPATSPAAIPARSRSGLIIIRPDGNHARDQ
jgi:hypothetical protein